MDVQMAEKLHAGERCFYNLVNLVNKSRETSLEVGGNVMKCPLCSKVKYSNLLQTLESSLSQVIYNDMKDLLFHLVLTIYSCR